MRILAAFTLCFLLTGCPGGPRAPEPRNTFISGDTLCFSIDRKDVLDYYRIESNESGHYDVVANSGKERLNVSYPQDCIKFSFKTGYDYAISYGLNGKNYIHEFSNEGDKTTY
ncbi:putative T6SS immunity periplasmic lipoprotein [Pseudescherichia vulneris]|uniref:putative T6SS immunity periplasmic lipoprotein n=1 Tax=Pseudescherichia vulneris TaxID=566 RepID=UPI0028A626D4|nr:putative T6SS immunity periplasmic lipoprotein [Pseudescherichia vulneris]